MIHSQPEGFLAIPHVGKGPGVLVLHAWWGLNDTIKSFCTRLAEFRFRGFCSGPLSWQDCRYHPWC